MRSGQSFDGFATDYDRFASLEPAGLRDWLVTQLPARGRRVLDAGCGSGRHTRVLAERFDHVVGVDISAPLIAIARDRPGPNVRYIVGDLMTFSDAHGFDLVFSSTTLHHVPDLDAALLRLRDLVMTGGVAILIDNVASRATPPRWVHVLGAVRNVLPDVARLGVRRAAWLLRFRTSAPWLEHLGSDRYLSRQEFERRYGLIFPGARFADLGYAHGLVWEKKNPAAMV
ncbi:MAG: class I SAM-dependent methyltransferase [Candidatus Dormibacteraeota bacterium]|nr:class I SAM-dependent methyltransferase [Candidatus Dormibacteraeota bacterium]